MHYSCLKQHLAQERSWQLARMACCALSLQFLSLSFATDLGYPMLLKTHGALSAMGFSTVSLCMLGRVPRGGDAPSGTMRFATLFTDGPSGRAYSLNEKSLVCCCRSAPKKRASGAVVPQTSLYLA